VRSFTAGTESASSTPPTACLTAARDDHGVVVASFRSTVGAMRQLAIAASDPELANYPINDEATICYIDGQIPKGPPAGTCYAPRAGFTVVFIDSRTGTFLSSEGWSPAPYGPVLGPSAGFAA